MVRNGDERVGVWRSRGRGGKNVPGYGEDGHGGREMWTGGFGGAEPMDRWAEGAYSVRGRGRMDPVQP